MIYQGKAVYTTKQAAEMTGIKPTLMSYETNCKWRGMVVGEDYFKLKRKEIVRLMIDNPADADMLRPLNKLNIYTDSGIEKLRVRKEQPVAFSFVPVRKIKTVKVEDLQVIEWQGQRVLTTEQLAQVYECEPANIKKNFNENKERFIEGKHFFKLEGEALQNLRVTNSDLQISFMTRCLYLWTVRGASRHSKILNTNMAWEVFEKLEDNYFDVNEQVQPIKPMTQDEIVAYLATQNVETKRQVQEIKATQEQQSKEIASIKEIIGIRLENWQEDCNKIVRYIVKEKLGGTQDKYAQVWTSIYETVGARAHADLHQRKKNRLKRMEQAGASKTAMKNLSMLSVIGDDPKLVEITITVVKEFAIKYGVTMTADHDVIELKVIDRKDIEA
jgi:hypothetical protein